MNPLRPAKSTQEKWAARALAILAQNDPDGARILNGVGFNCQDGGIGHSLAAMLAKRGGLTEKQWAAAIKICKKYHRQVGKCPEATVVEKIVETVREELKKEQQETLAGEISSREREQAGRPAEADGWTEARVRVLVCGCCTNGCICENHSNVDRGVKPAKCSFHAYGGGR